MGTETGYLNFFIFKFIVEKMGPLRGDGNNSFCTSDKIVYNCREDGSPSWGRKLLVTFVDKVFIIIVEKMGPLRGDGNS